MKAKVIKRFRDKKTKKYYNANDVYESSESRVMEIKSKGYLGEIIEEKVTDERLEGNVETVKQNVAELDQEELTKLLAEEKENKNRKGVVEHIEQLLSVFEEEEGE
ncbi:hypothetical protein ACLIBH_12380 [Virgibacillus sp. W0430]|uniref:hypothetical protein n=1 Tax=Virgibacillus sp. W0430 TaxID=3391580 RepID=UPI003F479345